MLKVPKNTSINTTEFMPDENCIGFAPELVQFIKDNLKLTTYRFGKKYDYLKAGDTVYCQNSDTGKIECGLKVVSKRESTFANLPLDRPSHEAYRSKDHQRKVFSGYYAFLGRPIQDDDVFLVFDFELVKI